MNAIEAELGIVRLLHEYGHHIDYGDAPAWLALFAPGARYVLRYRAGLTPRAIGKAAQEEGLVYAGDALAGFIAAHSHAPERYHKHFVGCWRIDWDGDRAGCTSYFQRIDATDQGARIVAAGRYLDRLVRSDSGRWQFEERIAEIEMQ